MTGTPETPQTPETLAVTTLTPDGETVRVHAYQDGDYVLADVRDVSGWAGSRKARTGIRSWCCAATRSASSSH